MEEQLMSMLSDLEYEAQELQESLLARNTECIWNALTRQDKLLDKLNALCLDQAQAVIGIALNNPDIRQKLSRSQRIVKTNRALSRRFLDVIDETLARLGSRPSSTYTGQGARARCGAPLLVRQQG